MPGATCKHRWFFALASVFLGAAAHAGNADAVQSIDDAQLTAYEQYAILCNTCTTAAQFKTKALTTYPRASESEAYVYNLGTGQIRGIKLDWDREFAVQNGGYEIPVEPGLVTYVQQAGSMYRQNGNSLAFKLILRADGSIYWKPASGPIVELRGAGLGQHFASVPVRAGETSAGAKANVMPGANSPIDARGYGFPANFDNSYPNYPETSYDLGFGNVPAGNINNYVRDLVTGLPNGGVAGIFNGTVQTSGGLSTPVPLLQGGQQVSKNITSSISIYIPMKDGGYARVQYDVVTGEVTLKEVQDATGTSLPVGGTASQFFSGGRMLKFPGTSSGSQGMFSFANWAARNGIQIGGTPQANGGSVKCSTNGSTQVICTIYPN